MKTSHLISLIFLAVALWSCGSKAEKSTPVTNPDEVVIPIKLAPVTTLVRAEPIVASGLVSSAEEARLSFKVGGIISQMFVDEGQTVHKGQLLATLDLTEINAQVSQAQLTTEKAERDLGRVKSLYADTAATLEQLQNATTGQRVAKQNLTIAQFNRNYAQIRSSVEGTVTRKATNAGEYVAPGASVYLISGNRPGDWVVRIGVSDKDWARLQLGNRATVTLDAYPGKTFTGSVTELAQAADPVSKLYEIEAKLQPTGVKLAPGLFAKVSLTPTQSRRYAVVPVEAIVEGNGREGFVYVLADKQANKPLTIKKIPVQIGFLDADNVLLISGLSGVTKVVTAGSAFLTEDANVVVK